MVRDIRWLAAAMPALGIHALLAPFGGAWYPIEKRPLLRGERTRAGRCPTGKSVIWLSSPSAKNISLAPSGKSVALTRAVSRHRGALANVINAAGDAMDADSAV